jgi:MFS family permease
MTLHISDGYCRGSIAYFISMQLLCFSCKRGKKVDFEDWGGYLEHCDVPLRANMKRYRIEPLLIFVTMLPVTGVVPILKHFVLDGFRVGDSWGHVFLSANMVAAFLFAPFVAGLAERRGSPRLFLSFAALLDGVCFIALPHVEAFQIAMAVRFIEGVFHIGVFALLLAIAGSRDGGRGPVMGKVGAAITFGVALGSPLGGMLGNTSATLALTAGGLLMMVIPLLAPLLNIPETIQRRSESLMGVMKQLVGSTRLRLPYLFAFLDRFTVGFFVACFPILMATKYDFTPARIGAHIAAFMLTMGLLCPFVVRLSKRYSAVSILLWGSATYGLLFSVVGWLPERLLFPWMLLLGVSSALMFIPTLQLATQLSPPGHVTASMGGYTAAGALGFLTGPLVSGLLLSLLTPSFSHDTAYALILLGGGLLEVAVAAVFLLQSGAAGLLSSRD